MAARPGTQRYAIDASRAIEAHIVDRLVDVEEPDDQRDQQREEAARAELEIGSVAEHEAGCEHECEIAGGERRESCAGGDAAEPAVPGAGDADRRVQARDSTMPPTC
jgi:hypothetical protein